MMCRYIINIKNGSAWSFIFIFYMRNEKLFYGIEVLLLCIETVSFYALFDDALYWTYIGFWRYREIGWLCQHLKFSNHITYSKLKASIFFHAIKNQYFLYYWNNLAVCPLNIWNNLPKNIYIYIKCYIVCTVHIILDKYLSIFNCIQSY